MRAPCLKANGTIGICSPSHVADREAYGEIFRGLERLGFRVKAGDNLYRDTYGYLASPQERAADFNQLVADPEVGLILFGGGEGSVELLPYLDWEALRRHPKRICSYSDGTTLLGPLWAKTGLETYYGQSPGFFREPSPYDQGQFRDWLAGEGAVRHVPSGPWHLLTPGVARGTLVGGYARNFALLLGSPYFPLDSQRDYLLFLEDHEVFGDLAYVSAMLSHIEQHPFMKRVRGLLFGHYSTQERPELLARLKRLGERWGIPVAACDDFGHGENHAILPIGREGELDTLRGELRYF